MLDPLGSAPAALPPSRLRLAWLDRRPAALGNQVLASYLAAALTHALRQAPPGRPWRHTLFVLGAERLPGDMLDRLARRLRDGARRAGAGLPVAPGARPGAAGARQRGGGVHAAGQRRRRQGGGEQIGTEHRFVVSQLTETVGTSVTDTTGGLLHQHGRHARTRSRTRPRSADTAGRSRGRGTSHGGGFAPFGRGHRLGQPGPQRLARAVGLGGRSPRASTPARPGAGAPPGRSGPATRWPPGRAAVPRVPGRAARAAAATAQRGAAHLRRAGRPAGGAGRRQPGHRRAAHGHPLTLDEAGREPG